MKLWGKSAESDLKIFFATDLHGSEICFRKALKAPEFYGASMLIIGGDLSGKALIPTVPSAEGRIADFLGKRECLITETDETQFARHVADSGYYVWPIDDLAELDDDCLRAQAYREAVCGRLAEWIDRADAYLSNTGMHCYMAPGNDDEQLVDEVLETSKSVINGEGELLDLRDGLRLASCGYSNPTPWHTHREETEDGLSSRMDRIVPQGEDCSNLVLNFHVPPYDSTLDVCAALDEDQRIIVNAGAPQMTNAGSSTTRHFIEDRQPLLALHGHIHECKGAATIGRTRCINPGSTYGDGMLAGCLIDLSCKAGVWRVDRYLLTSG